MLSKLLRLRVKYSINTLFKSTSYSISTIKIPQTKKLNTICINRKYKTINYGNYNYNQRLFWSKPSKPTEPTEPADAELLDHNKERSHDHKQEIMENQYPDLNKVSHPNSRTEDAAESDYYYIDKSRPKFEDYVLPHNIWTKEQLESVEITHKKPERVPDYLAYLTVSLMRFGWDLSTGYLLGRKLGLFKFSYRKWLLRVVFLETVAGVPGMMFGMVRHLNSLRRMERDRGWIKCLLAEAENERLHLLTAMHLYKPSKLLRYAIVIAQGLMCNFLFVAYLISPRYCHSFVGYLEEQAVHTYTHLIDDIEAGKYPEFEQDASKLSKAYWKLSPDATWKDVFMNIRADESNHRDVNHKLADLTDDPKALNPFRKVH